MDIVQTTEDIGEEVIAMVNRTLFKLGDFSVSLTSMFYLIALLVSLYLVSRLMQKFLMGRLRSYRMQNPSVDLIISIFHYSILFIGTVIILNSFGLNLGALAVLGGAIGLGLGFGLQNIADNFISGVIIMFERPVKVGHRVDVGEITGQVLRIGFRSTTVLTNDNIAIIIPNSKFVSDKVINWTHSDDLIRLRIPIGVSYEADPDHVVKVLQKIVNEAEHAHKGRSSDVILDSFGESSINFILRVWTKDLAKRPGVLRHEINMQIWKAFKEEKIKIPFPQMDLHIRSNVAKD